jgi:hypothetical protein
MTQVHKRFTAEQVKVLFQGYCQGNLSRSEVEEMLGIGKTRFFALLKSLSPRSACVYDRLPTLNPRTPDRGD